MHTQVPSAMPVAKPEGAATSSNVDSDGGGSGSVKCNQHSA
jgi:hypothetical protein